MLDISIITRYYRLQLAKRLGPVFTGDDLIHEGGLSPMLAKWIFWSAYVFNMPDPG